MHSEILPDERKETEATFWNRAEAHFRSLGIILKGVMTDNGSCYKSHMFNHALEATSIKHVYTRPYWPQTNGKIERFDRTLADELEYAKTYESERQRLDGYPA